MKPTRETFKIVRQALAQTAPRINPAFLIDRWSVYALDSVRDKNLGDFINFEILGNATEKIIVCLKLGLSGTEIEKIKYYYLKSGTDSEHALFLTQCLLQRLSNKYQILETLPFKELGF